jgi:CRISPR-associated endonuclease/helicase Cas3
VREGDDRDVTVWWWPVPEAQPPHRRLRAAHDALCRVPVGDARKWLFPGEQIAEDGQSEDEAGSVSKKARPRAWVWSYIDAEWRRIEEPDVYPGQTILVDANAGGYDVHIGFTGRPGIVPVEAGHARIMSASDAADGADEQEDLSEGLGDSSRQYKTIATHGAEVAIEGQKIASALGLRETIFEKAIKLAAIAHDVGKAHPAFAGAIRDRNGIPLDTALAKAPKGRWHGIRNLYDHSPLGKRPAFRHELASTLALFELVWRAHPTHPALQGNREVVLDVTVGREIPEHENRILQPQGILAELIGLDETALNLCLYFVMSHHGKVRATLPMSPKDQQNASSDGSLPIRGVREGDEIPALVLADTRRQEFELPRVELRLDPARLGLSRRYGPSWVERVLALRHHYGSFQLAWLEALMRVADVRASQIARPVDSRLPLDLVEVQATPDSLDRDADLRRWIENTVAAARPQPEAVTARRQGARHVAAEAAQTPTKRTRRGAS